MTIEEQTEEFFKTWEPRIIVAGVTKDEIGPKVHFIACTDKESTEEAAKQFLKPRFFSMREIEKPLFGE